MITSLTSTPCNAAPAAVAYVPPPAWSQYRGAWASGTTYQMNDVVYYAFSSWISLAAPNLGVAPNAAGAAWQLVCPGVDPSALMGAMESATASQSSAAISASAAAGSQAAAVTSASAAAGSASSASTSAASAVSAAATLAASLASFNQIYLGKLSKDPSTDNNGNALVSGAEYFNTTENKLRIYSASSGWADYDAAAQADTSNAALSASNAAASAAAAAGSAATAASQAASAATAAVATKLNALSGRATGDFQVTAPQPANTQYFAGLELATALNVNCSGLASTAALAAPGTALGPSGAPFVGIVSVMTANNGHGSQSQSLAAYRSAMNLQTQIYSGAGYSWGADIQLGYDQSAPTDISVIGLEIDMQSNNNHQFTLGDGLYGMGIVVTGGQSHAQGFTGIWCAAYECEGGGDTFRYGYVSNTGVRDVDFFSASTATTAFEVGGSGHTTGFYVVPGSVTGMQFQSNNFSVDTAGNLASASLTSGVFVVGGFGQVIDGGGNFLGKMPSYTVATLPTPTLGKTVYCSNARMFNGAGSLEASGSGTGGLVTGTGSAWRVAGTNITASA